MFGSLTKKFEQVFSSLRSKGGLTEADLDTALSEIKNALLDADVSLSLVKELVSSIKLKATGMKIIKSLNPGQMVIKYVHEELTRILGEASPLNLKFSPPVVILLVGLQGSGKTTSTAKLARWLIEEKKKKPLMVSVDVYRPAAINQLMTLGNQLGVQVFPSSEAEKPKDIAERALKHASNAGYDVLLIDTAGRLQIDKTLMDELIDIVEITEPHEVLLVADSMTGQESVRVAKAFDESLELDGLILTKMDGDSRGGAAISMRAITGKPIKFIGVGEKSDALEVFQPDRMATRILGMGDVLSLIEKASKQVSLEDAKNLEKKFRKNEFSFDDFLGQLQMMKKMGSVSSLMQMVPGMSQFSDKIQSGAPEKELKKIEAIIQSMTRLERSDDSIIDGSRKKRIAKGSGTSVEDINKLITQFSMMKKVMKQMSKMGPNAMKGLMSQLGGMGGGMGGFPGGLGNKFRK